MDVENTERNRIMGKRKRECGEDNNKGERTQEQKNVLREKSNESTRRQSSVKGDKEKE